MAKIFKKLDPIELWDKNPFENVDRAKRKGSICYDSMDQLTSSTKDAGLHDKYQLPKKS